MALNGLLELGWRLGRSPLLVQAAGGNISFKAGGSIAIKRSGERLKEMTAGSWARADLAAIRRGVPALRRYRSPVRRERAYVALLRRCGPKSGRPVSMETGFHAVLAQPYVAHLHSVGVILLGMMNRSGLSSFMKGSGRELEGHRWVPFRAPGMELAMEIADRLEGDPRERKPRHARAWLLRNHGVVWEAATERALANSSRRLERRLHAAFGLGRYPMPHEAGARGCRRLVRVQPPAPPGASRRELCLCRWPYCRFDLKPLFPDFVVYFGRGDIAKTWSRGVLIRAASPKDLRDKAEIFYAHALVSTLARRHGRLRRIPSAAVRTIAGLEAERVRRLGTAGR